MNTPALVIGAGITGLCTAYELVRRGHPVVVLDRAAPGESASGGNAGMLAAGHLPLPQPGLALKALRWMFDRDSPLYIPPRLDPDLFRWFWDFHRACTAGQLKLSMDVLTPMGRLTMAGWRDLLEKEKIPCDYRPSGWMNVYLTPEGRRDAEHDAEIVARCGFAVTRYDGPGLRAREPIYSAAVLGAVDFTDSASLDPGAFLRAFGKRLVALGVVLRTDVEVERLLVDGTRCHGVRLASGEEVRGTPTILAAGIWSTGLAAKAGIKVPMQGGKGYRLDVSMPSPALGTTAVLAEKFIAVTPMGDRLRLTGTVELSGLNHRLSSNRVSMLPRGAESYLRNMSGAQELGRGCDLRPCTADGLPVLGWAPGCDGLMISTGGAKMGLTLGPAVGRLAAEMILDGTPSLDITALRADRF